MGRLKHRQYPRKRNRFSLLINRWVPSIGIALLMVLSAHMTIFANPEPTAEQLSTYLQTNRLSVGTQTVEGYQQIFYNFNGTNFFVTDNKRNHLRPRASGEYMVWVENTDGGNNLIIYSVLTKSRLQITTESTNITPSVYSNKVVWEKWMGDRWHIYYYDGFSVSQLSSGPTSVRPRINNNTVVYAQESAGQWQVVTHDLNTGQDQISQVNGEEEAWPYFETDGRIESKFSLRYYDTL